LAYPVLLLPTFREVTNPGMLFLGALPSESSCYLFSCCGTELAEGEGAAVGCCSFSCCGAELAEVKEPQLVVARSPVAVLELLRVKEAGIECRWCVVGRF